MTPQRVDTSRSTATRLLAFALGFWCTCQGAWAHAAECSPESVGVDTSHGNTYFNVFMGSARGQVFDTQDTVLQAVSVWREPHPNYTALRLYVMELDSTGHPDDHRILRYGPTLQIEYGDGVHPIQFRFVLDPPLVLPGPDHYYFAVQVAPPVCDGATSLFGDTLDSYPAGACWRHSRSYPDFGCPLTVAKPGSLGEDLIFELEFCDTDAATVAVTEDLPAGFVLYQNQPNPFAASTTFRFDLPRPETVRLEVFDLMGRRVATVRAAWMPAGRHSLEWNSRDAGGSPVRPGAYVYRIAAGSFRSQRKLVVLP